MGTPVEARTNAGPYCDNCGTETDPYAHPATAPLCERCRRRCSVLSTAHAAFSFAALVLIIWVAVPRVIASQIGPTQLIQPERIWFAFYAALAVGIVLHEGAHALCARAFGFAVVSVRIGSGPLLFRTRIGGAEVIFRAVPFSGLTSWRPAAGEVTTTKRAVIAAAGPLANLCLAAVCWSLRAQDPYLAISAAGGNLLLFIQNVVPCPPRSAVGTPNDGWQILQNLVRSHWAHTHLHRLELAARCAVFTGSDGTKQAIEYLRSEISRHGGDDPDAEAMLCAYLLEPGSEHDAISEGFERSSRLLEDRRAAPLLRARALNKRALMLAIGGWPDLMEEAEWAARESLHVLQANPHVVGTLGFVLVRLGRFDEAEPMLGTAVDHGGNAAPADSTRSADLDRLLALHSCALGLLYSHTARHDAATSQQAQAQTLDPGCPVLPELEGLLVTA
jgi:Zn-dependent protease